MTGKTPPHPAEVLESDVDKKQRQHEKEAKDWLERGEDVRVNTAEDVRRMRRGVVALLVTLPIVLLSALYWHVSCYWQLLAPPEGDTTTESGMTATLAAEAALPQAEAAMIKALTMPMTALIIGTFFCVTAIYVALLVGLFKNASGSREKESTSGISPSFIASIIQKLTGNGG